MQFENFDKKIRDSLSQPPPGHDDPAWDKMEQLLDKHLPQQKKDRRRVIIFFFLFLLAVGGTFLIWENTNGNKNGSTIAKNKPVDEKPSAISTIKKESTDKQSIPISVESSNNKTDQFQQQPQLNNPEKNQIVTESKRVTDQKKVNSNIAGVQKKNKSNNTTIPEKTGTTKVINEPAKDVVENSSVAVREQTKTQPETNNQTTEKQESVKEAESTKQENETANKESNEKSVQTQTPKPNKQKNNKSFANNFFVTASAGPDFSAVSGTAGKVQLAWGGGIGYQISNRFSVRTGFYVTRKIYSADPEDYHPPTNFWQYYPNLKSIDANCKVYEIPITIDYVISKNKKSSWFASAGVSSLLMKEETYEYYFKPNSSPNYISYSRTINNVNKHYFSVLGLSGGYRRILNNHVSLQAEPYVKIAMSGIGYGKVDLNSGGILISAIIKPFASRK